MFGAMQLGQAGPNFTDIATAQGAAYQVFLVIDRVINLITFFIVRPGKSITPAITCLVGFSQHVNYFLAIIHLEVTYYSN